MKEAFKYYCLIIAIYCIELALFNIALYATSLESISINFFIRGLMIILFSRMVKKYVYPDSKEFYKTFYLLAAVNPILSSFLLWLISKFVMYDINFIKIFGDVVTSLILFLVLRKTFKN